MAVYVTFTILTLLLPNQYQRLHYKHNNSLPSRTFSMLSQLIVWYPMLAYNNLSYSISLQIKKYGRIKWDRDQSRIRKSPYFHHIDLVNACKIENKQTKMTLVFERCKSFGLFLIKNVP